MFVWYVSVCRLEEAKIINNTVTLLWHKYCHYVLKCSVTCGSGMRGRYVSCRDHYGNMAADSFCLNIPKPAAQERCMIKPCGEWRIGEWSTVSYNSEKY